MNDKKNIHKQVNNDNLKNFAPNLVKSSKENPFDVPANYFDDLPSVIQKRITERKLQHNWIGFIFKPQYAIAASLIIVAIISVVLIFKIQKPVNENNFFTNIFWEDILDENNYFINGLDENELIVTLINETDDINDLNLFNNKTTNNNDQTKNDTSIQSDDIIEYLIEEDINNYDLYNL